MDTMEARLAHLRRIGGEKFVCDLIDLFLATVPTRLEALRAAVSIGDGRGAARVGHSLTSSAGNLGLVELQQLTAALEQAEKTPETIIGLVEQIEHHWDLARSALEDRKKGFSP